MIPAVVLAWAVLLATCWLGWQLLRQNGRLLLRLEELEKRLDTLEHGEDEQPAGLPLGRDAPAFELPDLAGERKSLAQFRGQPLLLVFFNPACGFCRELVPKLAALNRPAGTLSHPLGVPLPLIITTGDAEENGQFFAEHKVHGPILLQKDGELAKAYQANGTPTGYLLDAEGRIASELAMGADALLALASGQRPQTSTPNSQPSPSGNGDGRETRFNNRSLARSKIKRDGLKAGTPAPDFRLPRLDGRGELSLSELRGRRVLLVFSSPSCGPCNSLAPELERFHRANEELQIVMISKGEPKENRAKIKEHGLTFPVVLQQQWEISRKYAMFSTPIAYLINEDGIVTHDVGVGAEAVMSLARRSSNDQEQQLQDTFSIN